YFLLIFFCFPLFAEDLTVLLETEVQLLPLHITHLVDEDSGFSSDYLRSLEKVLRFDFENNGMTTLVPANQSAYFEIDTKVKNKQFSARVTILSSNQIKTVEGIELTGSLAKDRRVIHTLSDSIFKTLFENDGIASTRFLYTVKKQNPAT